MSWLNRDVACGALSEPQGRRIASWTAAVLLWPHCFEFQWANGCCSRIWNPQKSFVFVSGFIPSGGLCFDSPPPSLPAAPSIRSRTRLPIFPHMFGPGGWSVRIALFMFQWQCAMSNSWWCTKPANPKTRGNSLMWRNLKAKGSGSGPKVIPHYHLILSCRGWRGQRYSSWGREMRRVLGPQWVVSSYSPPCTPTPPTLLWHTNRTLGTHTTMWTSNVSHWQTFLASQRCEFCPDGHVVVVYVNLGCFSADPE